MQKKGDTKSHWVIQAFCLTFVLSLLMSYITTNGISNLNIIPAILILIIGVAVTVADEAEFHAKASKKIKGSKTSIKLIRNASIVANICADVIGDVCGVLSGAISAMITVKLTRRFWFTRKYTAYNKCISSINDCRRKSNRKKYSE